MKKLDVKKSAMKLGERIAKESVGKSIPCYFYEPKIPAALKQSKQESDGTRYQLRYWEQMR